MSLPTPPATSHRDKENRAPNHVAWSCNQYHILTKNSPPKLPAASTPPKLLPVKSILKKRTHTVTCTEDEVEKKRSETPQPADPLGDPEYLGFPASRIISPTSTLRELIEGYFILAARLKATVDSTHDDPSRPLFRPLRDNCGAVVAAIIRDLGKALVNPIPTSDMSGEPLSELTAVASLPSPKSSPSKKQGMSAEQAKYARDLCTTAQAAIKLLMTMFSLPAVYKIFSNEQLHAMLNGVLDITLARTLPTPNARKTYALTILFLCDLTLPSEVLGPAADRIGSAIQRGVEGELGKEGKRGSIADGLRAIQELVGREPASFVPAFVTVVPGLLDCLTSKNPQIRAQACLALRGMAKACSALPYSWASCQISVSVAKTLDPANSAQTSSEPGLVQTLRTALGVAEPPSPAQGPIWSLCALANLIVLLGPLLCMNLKVQKAVFSLLSIAMQHRKSSVRALGCLVWRYLIWVYVHPDRIYEVQDEGLGRLDMKPHSDRDLDVWDQKHEELWKIIKSVVDMGTGVSTIVALLHDNTEGGHVERAMLLIRTMIAKGGQTCGDAMDLVHRFVTRVATPDFDRSNLLKALDEATPNLLKVAYGNVVSVVRPIFQKCPQVEDARSLTLRELTTDWIFEGLIDIWLLGLANLEYPQDNEIPSEVLDIWIGLLKPNAKSLQDDIQEMSRFAQRVVDIMAKILLDAKLDFAESTEIPTSPVKSLPSSSGSLRVPLATTRPYSNAALKLNLAIALWAAIRRCPGLRKLQVLIAPMLIEMLVKQHVTLIGGSDPQEDAREHWTRFCADVLVVCDTNVMRSFWTGKTDHIDWPAWDWTSTERSFVWQLFVTQWTKDMDICWERFSYLLVVPFIAAYATWWEMSTDDLRTWDASLCNAIERAYNSGIDSFSVLEQVAQSLSQEACMQTCQSIQIADLLISHLDLSEAHSIPVAVLDFVDDILFSSYPPTPSQMVPALWLIRSIINLIDACPWTLIDQFLECLQGSLCAWISDEHIAMSQEEYSYDIVPIYEIAVVSFKALPPAFSRLESLSPLLESAFCGRNDKPSSMQETFIEFWNAKYATVTPPTEWPQRIQKCLQISRIVSDAVADVFIPTIFTPDQPEIPSSPLTIPNSDASDLFDAEEAAALLEEHHTDSESDEEEIPPERPPLFEFCRRPPAGDEGQSAERSLVAALAPTTPAKQEVCRHELHSIALQILPFELPPKLEPPSTPMHRSGGYIQKFTPPRSRKPFVPRACSPVSPVPLSLSPSHSPLSLINKHSNGGNARKQYTSGDKENAPLALIPDRTRYNPPASRKRASPDEVEAWNTPKKRKADTAVTPMTPNDAEKLVPVIPSQVDNIFIAADKPDHQASRTTSDTQISSPSVSRKRKRVLLDCVEVPTLRQVRRHQRRAASLQSIVSPPNRNLGRTRSATTFTSGARLLESPGSLYERSPKRRCEAKSDTIDDAVLVSLCEVVVAGSDDSIMLDHDQDPPDDLRLDQSSDDDPYEGQVTPHHLISPELPRVQDTDGDPPSDDSILSNSPTREVAARRLERRGLGPSSLDRILLLL